MELRNNSNVNNYFVDILEERRLKSDIIWASRKWVTKAVYNKFDRYSPKQIKSIVLHSHRINKTMLKILNDKKVSLDELYTSVKEILNEIACERQESVLRWLGFFVSKALKKLLLGVYVNEHKFLGIRSKMGGNPLLFVPSHKSYFDFILMSYICFHYDVDIPRIAAGMDFQSMAFFGTVLRDACAFFMRRSFTDDELYTAVFSQYVHTLIVYGDAAIEFFIEGTRSRTQKSLMPKYGLLSMSLKPFLSGLVPDVTIVPVNLSYDRILEEILFAYELLGVPKPKETTRGLVKALSILNENYGNIYVQFGEPFSVKEFFNNKIDRSVHGFGPVEMQDITPEEAVCISNLAHCIVRKQKELTTINCFNIIALVLNNHFLTQYEPPHFDDLIFEVRWFFNYFKTLTPNTSVNTLESISEETVLHHLNLHKSLIHVSSDKKIQLSRIHSTQPNAVQQQLKGHALSNSTKDIAIPLLLLQIYANPCTPFLIGVCLIAIIIKSLSKMNSIAIDMLFSEFEFLCSIFSYEFVFHTDFVRKDFEDALQHSNHLRILQSVEENNFKKGDNNKLSSFCVNFLASFIPGYVTVMETLLESVDVILPEKQILKECQRRLELKLNSESSVHPANLSLDLLTNALQAMAAMKILTKKRGKNGLEYQINKEELKKIHSKLKAFDFYDNNKLNIMQQFSTFERANL